MKNKKVLALLISLVLIVAVALPGTLAVSSDQDAVNSDFTVDTAFPAPETATPAPETASPAPETQETTGEPEQAVAPETPAEVLTCTCGPAPAEGEPHAEGCPLAPLSCTCDPAPLEGEAHKEGCPLYVDPNAPIVINHIETCLEGCTGEECTCVCHLYEKIMACTSLDEVWAIMDAMTDEQWATLSESQFEAFDRLIAALDVIPAPEVPEEENDDPQIESEIIYPTVSYTNVAPFGAPVTGGQG